MNAMCSTTNVCGGFFCDIPGKYYFYKNVQNYTLLTNISEGNP
jgi:hypothetical protein